MYPPPPSAAYPPSPPPLRPVRGVAMFAVVALVCDSLVGVAAAVIDFWYAALVDRMIADPDSVTEAEINTGDLVYQVSGIVELLAYVVTAVAFLVWLFRVRENAEILAPDGHRRAKPWLIFGWIVPIIAYWFPKQIVDDIWDASARTPSPPKGLFHAWWAVWVVENLMATVVSRLLFDAEELDQIAAAARFDVVSIGLMLVAAVLAIFVVRRITDVQEEHRSAAFRGVPGAYPAY
ncbi:DUF4328 domain-containing protein [Nonomuraea sp. NBC_00507]|uniref:DUF4328 domain-containing protein n=1 Tax=Nonomuraea sp. NBC_00507 TaxID=2976002 RepID=UPI002E19E640